MIIGWTAVVGGEWQFAFRSGRVKTMSDEAMSLAESDFPTFAAYVLAQRGRETPQSVVHWAQTSIKNHAPLIRWYETKYPKYLARKAKRAA